MSLKACLPGTALFCVLCFYAAGSVWIHQLHGHSDSSNLGTKLVELRSPIAEHADPAEGELSEVILVGGLSLLRGAKAPAPAALSNGSTRVMTSQASEKTDSKPLFACRSVLVTHEYVPYAEHHGADTRLLDVLASLVSLGCADVHFLAFTTLLNPTEMQGWEQPKTQHIKALEALGVNFVSSADLERMASSSSSPSSTSSGVGSIGGNSLVRAVGHVLSALDPQFLVGTLWFWTWPTRPLWAGIVAEAHRRQRLRSLAHTTTSTQRQQRWQRWRRRRKEGLTANTTNPTRVHLGRERRLFLVLSDDVHGDREAKRAPPTDRKAPGRGADGRAYEGGADLLGATTRPLYPAYQQLPPAVAVAVAATTLSLSPAGGDRWSVELENPRDKAALLAPSPFRTSRVAQLELQVYQASDAVVTITSDDQHRVRDLLQQLRLASSDGDDGGGGGGDDDGVSSSNNNTNSDNREQQTDSQATTTPTLPLFPLPSVFTLRPSAAIAELARSSSFQGRSGFLFVGTGQNPTNVAAARWLLRSVWPLLRLHCPTAQLVIAGAPPPPLQSKNKRKSKKSRGSGGGGGVWDESVATAEQQLALGVRVLGFQKDLDPLLNRARVFVSPVRVASGFNTKNLLALSRGVPLVTTAFGNNGLPPGAAVVAAAANDVSVSKNKNGKKDEEKEEEATAFAGEMARLHEDVGSWEAQRVTAHEAAKRAFSETAVQQELLNVLQRVSSAAVPSNADPSASSFMSTSKPVLTASQTFSLVSPLPREPNAPPVESTTKGDGRLLPDYDLNTGPLLFIVSKEKQAH